ncbi:MAG: hypothetical protein ACO3I1_04000 [Burkholderiales bacterium]
MIVTLTPNEIHLAATHAIMRRFEKHQGKRSDRIQKERSTWDNEIEGACAELAFAKHLNAYWSGVSDLKAKDGAGMEVRWTKHETGGLIIYPHDDDKSVFVLAKGFAPEFKFVGWLRGADGKKLGRLTNFGYLVPAEKLHPIQ